MLYRIKKPLNIDEWPYWFHWMNSLDGEIINLDNYKIYENMHKKRYIVINGMAININWVEPLHSKPIKVEKNIKG